MRSLEKQVEAVERSNSLARLRATTGEKCHHEARRTSREENPDEERQGCSGATVARSRKARDDEEIVKREMGEKPDREERKGESCYEGMQEK